MGHLATVLRWYLQARTAGVGSFQAHASLGRHATALTAKRL